MRRHEFAPSLMCLDIMDAPRQMEIVSRNADMCHLDIMDGHFAPNLGISPVVAKAIRSATSLPIEAHLMTDKPADFIDMYIDSGADIITLHVETIATNAFRNFEYIKSKGAKAGLALCPATPLACATPLLGEIECLTIMTVDIGYSGQKFIEPCLAKIEEAREERERKGHSYKIQVDGGACGATFERLIKAGADRFVVGGALFYTGLPLEESFRRMYEEYDEIVGRGQGRGR